MISQYPAGYFVAGQGQYAPVESDDEGHAQPLEPHRWAVVVFTEDGTGRHAKCFHREGKRVGDDQPGKQALILIGPVNGVKYQAVNDKEEAVGGQFCDREHRR